MFMNTKSNEREKEKMMMKKEFFSVKFTLSFLSPFFFFHCVLGYDFFSLSISLSHSVYIYIFFLSPPYDTFGM